MPLKAVEMDESGKRKQRFQGESWRAWKDHPEVEYAAIGYRRGNLRSLQSREKEKSDVMEMCAEEGIINCVKWSQEVKSKKKHLSAGFNNKEVAGNPAQINYTWSCGSCNDYTE